MKTKKILIIFIILICFITFSCLEEETFIDGDFTLVEYDSSYKIVGLSEEGKTKSHIVIPNTYKGKKLRCEVLSYITWGERKLPIIADDASRVYFESNHFFKDGSIYGYDKKMFLCQDVNRISGGFIDDDRYIGSNVFFEYAKIEKLIVINNSIRDWFDGTYRPANVSFNYNYEGSPNNGYYWIDDYSDELIEYKPKNPIRIGYGFMGWYKEPECINEWDFEEDIVPKKIYVERYIESKELMFRFYEYKETILYAKWV